MKKSTYDKMLSVLTEQQIESLVDMLSRVQERARDRKCQQSIEIIFNEKGFPRTLKASDNIRLPYDQDLTDFEK